jgi:uncharacterized protein (DUF433 family)
MNERIEINPRICHGKPVVRGTRVLVSTVLGALGAGDSIETILEDYSSISREDIQAALSISDFCFPISALLTNHFAFPLYSARR